MNSARDVRSWPVAALLLSVLLGGCGEQRYRRFQPDREALRRVERLDLEAMSAPASGLGEPNLPPAAALAERTLTLEECRGFALAHSLDLKVQLLNPTIARQAITQEEARFEALFTVDSTWSKTDQPVSLALDASQADYFRANPGVALPLRTGGSVRVEAPLSRTETNSIFSLLNPAYTSDAAVSISQPLLRNAGVQANTTAIQIARYQTDLTEAQTKLQVISLLYGVDAVYWRLYAARRALDVVRQDHDLAVALREQAQRKVAAGTAAEIEVISAEAGVAERTEAIIVAENAVRERQRELKRVLNVPHLPLSGATRLIPGTPPSPRRYRLDADRLVACGLQQRMELLEIELQLAQDRSTIDYRRNQVLPLLSLSYSYNVNGLGRRYGDALAVLDDWRFTDHFAGLRLEVPLGNQAAQSQLRQAIYTHLQRLTTRQQRELAIEQEVRNAADNVEAAWQRILASRQSALLAGRNLAAEQRQFAMGLRTATDVLNAQSRLANAQLAEIRALTDYEVSLADLALATGTTLGAAHVRWATAEPPAVVPNATRPMGDTYPQGH